MRKVLHLVESARLVYLILNEYTKSKKDDAEFAKWASEQLNLSINTAQVRARRVGLQIESNNAKRKNGKETLACKVSGHAEVITLILQRLDTLEAALNKRGKK